MKKIYLKLLTLLVMVALLASCGRADVLLHDDDANVYADTFSESQFDDDIVFFDELLSSEFQDSSDVSSDVSSDILANAGVPQNNSSFGSNINNGSSIISGTFSSNSVGPSAGAGTSSKAAAASSQKSSVTSSTQSGNSSSYTPTYYASYTKAVWISQWNLQSVFNSSSTSAQFQSQINNIMQKVKNYGFNTVVVQLRPNGDSFYPSSYYPWSKFCSGTVGKAPNYDPTAIMVNAAHNYGLSFHAWFNPLRLSGTSELAATPSEFLTRQWYNNKRGTYVVQSGSYWYLNPAYAETRNLIINGAVEILKKYKVDALHIDDYFYPTQDASFDKEAYAAYGAGKSLADWRRGNINTLVSGIYSAIKKQNSKIKFGISPAGNINNNLNDLYADVSLWSKSSGYMDYVMPQIYFGYKHNTLDYLKCLNQWNNLVTNSNISLIVGLGAYKIGLSSDGGSNEWATDTTILKRQVQDAKSKLGSKYKGFCIFDYDSFFSTDSLNTKQRDNMKTVI